jgi:hypothetical protein
MNTDEHSQAKRGQAMHKQREGRGQKPLIPKILGTAAVRREGENAARKGKNAEETLTHVAISTLGELKTLRLGFIKSDKTFE